MFTEFLMYHVGSSFLKILVYQAQRQNFIGIMIPDGMICDRKKECRVSRVCVSRSVRTYPSFRVVQSDRGSFEVVRDSIDVKHQVRLGCGSPLLFVRVSKEVIRVN